MKIGIDIRCLMEPQYSGISEYTYNLLKHLFALDTQNQYILFYNASNRNLVVPNFQAPNVTVKGFHYPNKVFNLALRYLKITKLDQLIGGVDVFVVPNFLFTNLSKDVKKVVIVHDLSFELYPSFFTFKKRLWHRLIQPKKMCEQADWVVAISENTKRDIINQYDIKEEKIIVSYPGISELFFQPITQADRDRVKKTYNLPDQYILSLGNLEPRKNLTTLLRAFERLPRHYNLVLVGQQAWKYQSLHRQYLRSQARERIVFTGYVANEDRPALYSLAGAFVYPSIYEGFGLPPLEAMACGTPVITSFASSLPEAVGSAALLVDPHNVNDISVAIKNVTTDPLLANQLRERGLRQATQFHWQKSATELFDIITQLP